VRTRRVVDYLVYLVVRILICFIQGMQMRTAQQLSRSAAWLLAHVLGVRRGVVDDNLHHAFPDLTPVERDSLTQRMWEHLFLLVYEVTQASRKIHQTNWRQFARLHDMDRAVRLLLAGRPTVIVTAHFGNFEIGGFMLGILGFPTYTVARTLDNRYLDRFINRFRGATGQFIIPKNGGYDQILDVLARGGIMSFLADQYAGPKGCWVDFFGRPASAHKAIALLSLEHDAPIMVCSAKRRERPMEFDVTLTAVADPRDTGNDVGTMRELTQWYISRLEEMVRQAPDQYWWLHRRWKEPPPAIARRLSKAA
jgi:Kdo2-lipid IVA lauroyltransferase/acyltransferase